MSHIITAMQKHDQQQHLPLPFPFGRVLYLVSVAACLAWLCSGSLLSLFEFRLTPESEAAIRKLTYYVDSFPPRVSDTRIHAVWNNTDGLDEVQITELQVAHLLFRLLVEMCAHKYQATNVHVHPEQCAIWCLCIRCRTSDAKVTLLDHY